MEGTINKELQALISLLDEPDYKVFAEIREKIFSFGADAIPLLENAWENTFNPDIQLRIEEIIHKLHIDNLYVELQNWLHFEANNLLKGAILIAKYQYPDLDDQKVIKKIAEIKQDIWLELSNNLTGLEKIKVFNHIIFDIYKFKGNKNNIQAPQNSYINNVIESKKGNPLSLGILYIHLASALHIPVYGVNLPNHFILAYLKDVTEYKFNYADEKEVLFYINPFNKGAVFTRREVDLFIKQLKIKPEKSFYQPCSHIDIIRRLINNLIKSYEKLGYPDKIKELKFLIKALS